MGRPEKDYGLPRLTFEEAARLLGVTVGHFMEWALATARPSDGRWSKWKHDREPLPESIVRLYLMTHAKKARGKAPTTPAERLAARMRLG
jgi:hypothetical protein